MCSPPWRTHLLDLKPPHAGAAVEEARELLHVWAAENDAPLVQQQPRQRVAVQHEADAGPDQAVH